MDRRFLDTFFSLLGRAVSDEVTLTDEHRETMRERAALLLEAGQKHDLAHLMGYALFQEGLSDLYTPFAEDHMLALFRHEGLAFEKERVCDLLSGAEIPHIPLKGAVLRDYYPEPWMRTSCDVDVLVRAEDFDRAVVCMEQNGYEANFRTTHDVSFYSEGGIHIELHFTLIEHTLVTQTHALLASVWDYALPVEGKDYTMALRDDFFYFYHVAHMAKHFAAGGCGIRSFLDLHILETLPHDEEARAAMIEAGGIAAFHKTAVGLCRRWFGGAYTEDSFLDLAEHFVLYGGTYGSKLNYVALNQGKHGGRFGYLLYRAFPPYRQMVKIYPFLKKCPPLLPFLWIARWFSHLFRGGAKRALREVARNQNVTPAERAAIENMMKTLELKKRED